MSDLGIENVGEQAWDRKCWGSEHGIENVGEKLRKAEESKLRIGKCQLPDGFDDMMAGK